MERRGGKGRHTSYLGSLEGLGFGSWMPSLQYDERSADLKVEILGICFGDGSGRAFIS